MADATLKQILEFFGKKDGQSLSEFTKEWKELDSDPAMRGQR